MVTQHIIHLPDRNAMPKSLRLGPSGRRLTWNPRRICQLKRPENKQQAMIILRGMEEHRFSNVYYYQCLTLMRGSYSS